MSKALSGSNRPVILRMPPVPAVRRVSRTPASSYWTGMAFTPDLPVPSRSGVAGLGDASPAVDGVIARLGAQWRRSHSGRFSRARVAVSTTSTVPVGRDVLDPDRLDPGVEKGRDPRPYGGGRARMGMSRGV